MNIEDIKYQRLSENKRIYLDSFKDVKIINNKAFFHYHLILDEYRINYFPASDTLSTYVFSNMTLDDSEFIKEEIKKRLCLI